MIHEIYPKKFYVDYMSCVPEQDDTIFIFDKDAIYCKMENGEIAFPKYREFEPADGRAFTYLFSIDKERYFLPDVRMNRGIDAPQGYERNEHGIFRIAGPRHLAFAAVTAQQLYLWYAQNRYCGCCGTETAHSENERACVCPQCGLTSYPKISPVVIVAVTHGDNLLVTRYKDRPIRRYALVAGFAEIGESLEDTVIREVFEETGIKVKNIRYYKSQPWGFTSTLLSGFYCELD